MRAAERGYIAGHGEEYGVFEGEARIYTIRALRNLTPMGYSTDLVSREPPQKVAQKPTIILPL